MQYDEIKYGKIIKLNGFQTDNLKYEITVLSKYLKHIDNMKPKEHKEFVYSLCHKNISDFNEVMHYKLIDSCIRKGRDKNQYPIQIKSIPIYTEQLKAVDECDVVDDYKKVMLTMLVELNIKAEKRSQKNKKDFDLSLCYYQNRRSEKETFNSSRIGSTYNIKHVIGDLTRELDRSILSDIGRSKIILNFAEDIEVDDIFYNLQSCDFDKIGWVWDLYKNNKKVIKCIECDKLIKKKLRSKSTRCSVCQQKKDKDDTRARVAKLRM